MKVRNSSISVGVLAFLACTNLGAESRPAVGQATEQWFDLQKSGEQASEESRPLSGEAAGRSYERYLRSFENDIPDQFEDAGRERN